MKTDNVIKSILVCSLVTGAVMAGEAWATVPPVVATEGSGMSVDALSMVRVVRHAKQDKDPMTKYGAGFTVVVFNKSGEPVSVGPESIVVKDRSGASMTLLTAARVAQLKQAEADRAQARAAIFAIGMSLLSGAAAANAHTPGQASDILANNVASTSLIMGMGQSTAAAISSETDAAVATYNATPLVSAVVPPLHQLSGRVLVEKMKDADPAAVIVTVGNETHEIDFGKLKK